MYNEKTLCLITETDLDLQKLIADDPVRPHIDPQKRISPGREVYVLGTFGETNIVDAIICVAYTNEVPFTEQEMEIFSQQACQDNQHGKVAIFYTVWSYSKGSGREIVLRTARLIKETKPVNRFVTLSPLTEMAEKFHIKNGAKLINKSLTCQNFEYFLD